MVACDRTDMPSGDHNYCVFAGRRDGKDFALSDEEIVEKYRNNLCMVERMPDALSGAMGNRAFLAAVPTKEALKRFWKDTVRSK